MGAAYLGGPSLGVSHEGAIIWWLNWDCWLYSKMVHSYAGKLMLAFGGSLSSTPRGPLRRLFVLTYGSFLIQGRWAKRARQQPKCLLWLNIRSHTTSFSPYPIGYTDQPYSMWQRTTQRGKYQGIIIGGQSWWLATTITNLVKYSRILERKMKSLGSLVSHPSVVKVV